MNSQGNDKRFVDSVMSVLDGAKLAYPVFERLAKVALEKDRTGPIGIRMMKYAYHIAGLADLDEQESFWSQALIKALYDAGDSIVADYFAKEQNDG